MVDVRSPGEYMRGHIPGAHLIPLFDNEERMLVGITYKNVNRQTAIKKGLGIVGPKMAEFVRLAEEIAGDNPLLLYCWRGGMRSQSMGWLFDTAGIHTRVLNGGYKHYRRYLRTRFVEARHLLILGGFTGSGKSEILREIALRQQQVIDLEELACHKGSAFGAIGQKPQPTTEQFENNLFERWRKLDLDNTIWLEDESKSIGSIQIPDEIFRTMKCSPVIMISLPLAMRVERLVREYTGCDPSLLLTSIRNISKRLGHENTLAATTALEKGDFHSVADITLRYYDKAYSHTLEKKCTSQLHVLELNEDNPSAAADIIISFAREKGLLF